MRFLLWTQGRIQAEAETSGRVQSEQAKCTEKARESQRGADEQEGVALAKRPKGDKGPVTKMLDWGKKSTALSLGWRRVE